MIMLELANENFDEIYDLLYSVVFDIDPLLRLNRQVRNFKESINDENIGPIIRSIVL